MSRIPVLEIDHAVVVLVGKWRDGEHFTKSTVKPLGFSMAVGDSLNVSYTMNLNPNDVVGRIEGDVADPLDQLADIFIELNLLAAWNDGMVGTHMDEPHAASVARRLLAKYGRSFHLPSDDTEGGHHD